MAQVIQRRRLPTDYALFNLILTLLVVGVVMVFDASYVQSMQVTRFGNDAYYYLKRQGMYACVGLLAMCVVMRIGYWRLRRAAPALLILALVMLVLVWMPGIGVVRNGAHRWLGWGMFQFQPSEFAKLALTIYLAALLARNAYDIRHLGDGLAVPLGIVGLFVVLIEAEPDLGTAVVLGAGSLTLLFLAGARKRHLGAVILLAGLVGGTVVLRHEYRRERLLTFVQPSRDPTGHGYQVRHGILAVGSGSLVGMGLGSGREKFYLPEANTDYIFATIAEETGLLGSALVVGLLFLVGWRGLVIARRTRDTYGAMLAAGISAMISWQALINVAVVTGSIPATGVPLPFVSYGGSSLVFLLMSVGILLNIAQHPDAARS